MLVAVSGGAGFLGLHLARRLRADGHAVRSLDLLPLDDPLLEGQVEEIVGDVRDVAAARGLVAGADVVVHAAAALPIQAAWEAIRSVNVDGTATVLAAALEAGVGRAIFISSTAVYGVPERHPIREDDPLVGVGAYGGSKIEAEAVCRAFELRGLETVILRPKTFLGPERLGVFEILFDWIREGRRIPILGDGSNRYQLLAVDDLVEAVVRCFGAPVAGQAFNVGAARFGSVRDDLGVLCAHAGFGLPVAAGPGAVRQSSPCAGSSCSSFRRSRSGTTEPLIGTPTWRSTGRGGCSAGSRACRTRRLCARPTTGTSRTGIGSATRA